jgi:hypothetical protein
VTETETVGAVCTYVRSALMPNSALVGKMFVKMSDEFMWHSNDVLGIEIAQVLIDKIPVQSQRRPWLAEVGPEFCN